MLHVRTRTRMWELCGTRGFTLVEVLIVLLIVSILAVSAVPKFFDAARKRELMQVSQNTAALMERGRSAALSSVTEDRRTVPAGGYGVMVSKAAQEVTYFMDDWNAVAGRKVATGFDAAAAGQMAQFAATYTVPDGVYTAGNDTELDTVSTSPKPMVNLEKIQVLPVGAADIPSNWVDTESVTMVFLPPHAEVRIWDALPTACSAGGTGCGSVRLVFRLGADTDALRRVVMLNRVTTSPILSYE